MANVQAIRKEKVILNLDREREMKFTLSAFADMEARYGSVDKAMDAIRQDGMKGMRVLLYLGLRHEDRNLTEEAAGDLIDIRDMNMISEAIGKCFGNEGTPNTGVSATNPNA